MRNYLDQVITLVDDDEVTLDGTGTRLLRLPERPVRRVASVVEDDTELTETTDYILRDSILIRVDTFWSKGTANVTVNYDHGWDVVGDSDSDSEFFPVPADISLVTLSAARRAYNTLGIQSLPVDIKSETIGAYSYTTNSSTEDSLVDLTLLSAEKYVLDPYKFRGN